ncbi:MAG: amidohydrolase family protein [Bacillota bacterium]|nr:amidohydrolase family protein [Bacillota bacterium]
MYTAITNARVIVPHGVLERGTVVFSQDGIAYVGDFLPSEYQPVTTVDGTGKTLMPGLIDAHVHITMEPDANPWLRMNDSDALIALRAARNAHATLAAGFTTVRDLGAKNYIDLSLRDAIKQGVVQGPHMLAAGKCICMTGGHGWMMGREADSPDEARKAAREQLKAGADVIKIMATGGVMTPGVEPGAQQLTREEMAAAISEAVKAGKKTATHAQGRTGIMEAVLAGIHSVEHGFYLDAELCEEMVRRGVYLVPTLVAPYWIVEKGIEAGIPVWAVDKAKASQEAHLKSFELAVQSGVKVAMGTDAGTPFNRHGKNALELELMVKSGLSPRQAIESATLAAADLLGISNLTGDITQGKRADLVLVEGDPLQDIKLLQTSIVKVWKDGVLI